MDVILCALQKDVICQGGATGITIQEFYELARKRYQELFNIELTESGREQLWEAVKPCGLFKFVLFS
jgi:hypothetical protein